MNYRQLLASILFITILSACDSGVVSTESSVASNSAEQAKATGISHGEYVARLGNCIACHSIPEGKPFTGGLKMAVPMLGAIYATNITPDPETGIGNYTFEDFDKAMRAGITKDGRHLYPAMPYPSYAKMSEQDMRALYDFFMNDVPPVVQPNPANEIPTWKSPRWPLAIWNVMTVNGNPFTSNPEKSDEWNRGAYLTEGLGHCGACHTPRGLLMQEKGLSASDSDFLSGALLDNWSASSLNGDMDSGLGRWSVNDIAEFLGTGHNQFGTAFGTMVEVINSSSAHMSKADLNAMAVYLKSLPAVNEIENTYAYDKAEATKLLALDFSKTGSQTYYEYCSNCHGTDGQGYYPYQPPLAGNPVILDPRPESLINLTLNGSLRVVNDAGPDVNDMPYFRQLLNDQQIADVVSYIRNAWGNSSAATTANQVAKIRASTDPTLNNDIHILKMK